MKKKLPTVTVGIPAFNEEANIKNLLISLLSQRSENFVLREIIVSSDGSTDQTNVIVKRFKSSKIKLFLSSLRMGLARNQNRIIKKTQSDILILINADMRIESTEFLEQLVKPIIERGVDLAAANLQPLPQSRFWEKLVAIGVHYKRKVYDDLEGGDNWFTCFGGCRAFSKRLYERLTFKHSVGEDMYSYFLTRSLGFNYEFARQAVIYYKLPGTFSDHLKQSRRYFNNLGLLESMFGKQFIKENYDFPIRQFLIQGARLVLEHRLYAVLYPLLALSTKILANFQKAQSREEKWQMAISSKVLI